MIRSIGLLAVACLVATPSWAQETYSVGLAHASDGEVIPLFEFRGSEWHQIQPQAPWAASAATSSDWRAPARWYYYHLSRYGWVDVDAPVRSESDIWVQRSPRSTWPAPRRVLVVSDTLKTRPYGFTDFRNSPYWPTIMAEALRDEFDQAEGIWISDNGPVGPRLDQAAGTPGDIGAPIVFTRFDQSPRGEWWYVRATRVYAPPQGSYPPRCWKRTSLVGWIRVAFPDNTLEDSALEFQHGGCDFKGLSSLELLGEVELEGRRFVIALRTGYEGRLPIIVELTADGPVVRAELSVGLR